MPRWWSDLDNLLRGQATRQENLRDGRLNVRAGRLLLVLLFLGMAFGICMGSFALMRGTGSGQDPAGPWWQLLATTLKVPALYLLTLLVTFPSLYVFSALVGSRLEVVTVFRLLIASLVVTLAVLASLGPIVAFFGASTTSYPFMKLLNVAVFATSGMLGLGFLLRTLQRLGNAESIPLEGDPLIRPHAQNVGPLQATGAVSSQVRLLFRCWVGLFGLVGAQMAWVLRPFLGSPNLSFRWFRPRDSNFFQAVLESLSSLLR
jgi:hypothetical protein